MMSPPCGNIWQGVGEGKAGKLEGGRKHKDGKREGRDSGDLWPCKASPKPRHDFQNSIVMAWLADENFQELSSLHARKSYH